MMCLSLYFNLHTSRYIMLQTISKSPTPLHFAFAIGCFEAEGPFIGGTGHRDEVHLGTAGTSPSPVKTHC